MKTDQGKFILLRKIKYGEADLIIHGLSQTGSKKSFMARGALRSKKRFGGGVLEPIHFVNLTFKTSGDSHGLCQLLEAQLIDDFKETRDSYPQLELALYIVRCVASVSQEEDQDSSFLFNLTGHALKKITITKSEKQIQRLKLHFNLKFLFQQGVIEIDPWMKPFLKINLSDSESVDGVDGVQSSIDDFADSIDLLVEHYLRSADTT